MAHGPKKGTLGGAFLAVDDQLVPTAEVHLGGREGVGISGRREGGRWGGGREGGREKGRGDMCTLMAGRMGARLEGTGMVGWGRGDTSRKGRKGAVGLGCAEEVGGRWLRVGAKGEEGGYG